METDPNIKNPLDELEDAQENVAGEATEGAQTSANVEPSTLQVEATKQAPTEQFVPPIAPPVTPPIAPRPVAMTAPSAPASVKTELSEPDFRMEAKKRHEKTVERLQKQPKVWFMIPVVPGEAKGLSYETVTIDGFRMEIKKGTMVELPKQVVEILAEKYRVEMTAGSDNRIDGDQEKATALS